MALEQIFAATPAVGDGGRIIASPFQFLFTGEDKLQLLIVNSAAGVTVQFATRFLQAGTKAPQSSAPTFTPTADRTVNTFNIDVGTGYLLNCSAIVVAGSPLVGQTYVMVRILRGASGATLMLGAMLGGYVTAKQALAYPGSPIESSIAGGGNVRFIQGTTPAIGADIAETVPTGARWEVLWFRAVFTTSGVAANRRAYFSGRDPAQTMFTSIPGSTVGSGLTVSHTWAQNFPIANDASNGYSNQPIPRPALLLAGQQLLTNTLNIDVADRWFNVVYQVREWLEAA